MVNQSMCRLVSVSFMVLCMLFVLSSDILADFVYNGTLGSVVQDGDMFVSLVKLQQTTDLVPIQFW